MLWVLVTAASAAPAPSATNVVGAPDPATIGYWALTWEAHDPPPNANVGIAFSGWNDPANALAESNAIKDTLVGAKWIDAGGGNVNGRWNSTWISKWVNLIKNGGLATWDGIVLDVEECFETGLADGFVSLLHTAKAHGLSTMVTVSADAPYACDDAKALMHAFFVNDDCDFLSPQLYADSAAGDDPTKPSFVTTWGADVPWDDWIGAKPAFAPSLTVTAVKNAGFQATYEHFAPMGINTTGYVQWPTETRRLR